MQVARNYKPLIFPLFVVVVLAFLVVAVGNFLFGRINSVRERTMSLSRENEVLASRLATLQAVDGQVSAIVNDAVLAIPATNPSAMISQQLRAIAAESEISIAELEIHDSSSVLEPGEEIDLRTYEVNLTLQDEDYQSIMAYVQTLSTIRPIMNLQTLIVEGGRGGFVEAQLKLNAYSAAFPKTLPELAETLSSLTPAEQEILSLISTFVAPELGVEATPREVVSREDPFSLDF